MRTWTAIGHASGTLQMVGEPTQHCQFGPFAARRPDMSRHAGIGRSIALAWGSDVQPMHSRAMALRPEQSSGYVNVSLEGGRDLTTTKERNRSHGLASLGEALA
jgi:hypothetical protein